jgi:hypothetical protein
MEIRRSGFCRPKHDQLGPTHGSIFQKFFEGARIGKTIKRSQNETVFAFISRQNYEEKNISSGEVLDFLMGYESSAQTTNIELK